MYRKHMATPFPMTDMSTMPSKVKKTMMVQEVVRIRRDLRQGLPWNVTVKHLNNFCQRMKASRYDQSNRFQVLKSGVEGFEKMLEVKRGGGRPINRQRSWEEEERQKKKELQSKVWYHSISSNVCNLISGKGNFFNESQCIVEFVFLSGFFCGSKVSINFSN